jgi:hypothetical protein
VSSMNISGLPNNKNHSAILMWDDKPNQSPSRRNDCLKTCRNMDSNEHVSIWIFNVVE